MGPLGCWTLSFILIRVMVTQVHAFVKFTESTHGFFLKRVRSSKKNSTKRGKVQSTNTRWSRNNIIKTYMGLPIIKTYMVQWLRLCLTIQVTKTPGATE